MRGISIGGRQSHLRALAASTTTSAVRDRLLEEAEQHEKLAQTAGEPTMDEIAARG